MKKIWAAGVCIAAAFLFACVGGSCLAEVSHNTFVLPEGEAPAAIVPEKEAAERSTAASDQKKLRGYDAEYGDYQYVYMGEYEQSRNGQPILWRVLTVEGNDALLLSEYILATRPYGEVNNWEKSDIKDWLNSEFAKKAFSWKERRAICDSDSRGRVFILSESELLNTDYGFSPEDDQDKRRSAKGTPLAVDEGLYVNDDNQCSTYYTRTVCDEKTVFSVTSSGVFGASRLNRKDVGIRPAIWVDLEKISFDEGEGTIQDPYR
ncbi:MAG: hypothetical protein J6K32_11700 [Clostridia bacterium]|nr:hypothetical protein [Clostridia bacterium]